MADSSADNARKEQDSRDQAREEMKEFEQRDELPTDLHEWPSGKAKYITFDNDEESAYGEGLTEKLGPPVVHHEDGSVSVNGEKVDNPEDYKGEPIELATPIGSGERKRIDESAKHGTDGRP